MTPTKPMRQRPEEALQATVCKFLSRALGDNSWFGAIPLGGGGRMRGQTLKRTGSKAGTPDLLVISNGIATWLELKSEKGRVSDAQVYCHQQLRRAGAQVYVCRNLEDVAAALNTAGVPLKAEIMA